MSKKNKHRPQHSKSERSYSSGGHFKNDQMSRQLNKLMGLPEDFEGNLEGFEDTVPMAVKVFGATKVEEVPRDEKCYSPNK